MSIRKTPFHLQPAHMSALLLACALLGSPPAQAAATVDECRATLAKFRELGNVPELLAESYGYAVLPTIGKGGIGIGAAGGTGCVFRGGTHTGKVSMGQVSIGWQLGGQAYSQLILFKNADTYDEFTRGQFEFGADASAVALTYGAQAGASTKGASASAGDTQGVGMWKRGMAVFTLAKGGLMYEAAIGGQKFNFKPLGD
ncbi:MAG TPA: lipid-binding SYLF domain-containing protein [Xanthomonadales bacterium]|nr:lipid-binding SYLF domain-containing protein [Xanthomonadales bacterium]